MTANLALSVGLSVREASTVLLPAVSGPVWEVGGGRAGARYLEDMARTAAVTLLTLTPENAGHVRVAAARMSHASARGAIGAWVEAEAGRMAGRDLPEPRVYEFRQTSDEVVAEIDRLLDDHTDGEIVMILNGRGCRTGHGLAFTLKLVKSTRWNRSLRSRYERLRDRGLLTVHEAADRLGVSIPTIRKWRKTGLLRGHAYNDKSDYLYEIPDPPPTKQPGRWLSRRKPICEPVPYRNNGGVV